MLDVLDHRPLEEQLPGLVVASQPMLRSRSRSGPCRSRGRLRPRDAARRGAVLDGGEARQPFSRRARDRRISSSHRASSSQSWMLEPSSNGTKRPAVAGQPRETVARPIQLLDHQRVEQADQVGTRRDPIAGPGLINRAGASHAFPRLQHQDPASPTLPGKRHRPVHCVRRPTTIASHFRVPSSRTGVESSRHPRVSRVL